MMMFMIVICLLYMALVFYIAKRIVSIEIERDEKQISKNQASFQKLVELKEEIKN